MKRSFPDQHRPYLAPGGKWAGYISIGGSILILLAITLPASPAALKWPLEWAMLTGFVSARRNTLDSFQKKSQHNFTGRARSSDFRKI
ncbi:MAG: hypothetical protein U5K54_18330 [Cytophagales bacterium]|nr:hypothetical protein [Cytophagales bacterium]